LKPYDSGNKDTFCNEILYTSSFDASSGYLSPVEASKGSCNLVGGLLYFSFAGAKNDLHMCGVALVRVNATMRTICATASFLRKSNKKEISEIEPELLSISSYRSLLYNNAFDEQFLDINAFSISV
jgi:hypothetical protein